MKELLASLKLIKKRYRYFIKSECKRCGYIGMTEAGPYRDQPDAEPQICALIDEWINQTPRCIKCRWPGLEFSVHVLRQTDKRRLWVFAFVLLVILGAFMEGVQG